jgi:tripartite-type tricarboxylate transporter receptor subunit TctC
MTLWKTLTLAAAIVIGTAPLSSAAANATHYPHKPITFVVGFPPGTSTDAVARIIGEQFSKDLGQPVIVENKPGVGGSLAVSQVARAAPDGYTLVLSATAPMNINPHVYDNLTYDPLNDFEYIGQSTWLPYLLVTNMKKGLDSFQKIVDYGRQHPGDLTFASIGMGTTSHLLMEMLMKEADIEMVHVPYMGSSQAQTDVVGGNVDMTFDTLVSTLPHVRNGRLQAIAVSTGQRAKMDPSIPTIEESGIKGFDMGAWLGFFAPKGTPEDILEKLHTQLNKTLQNSQVNDKLTALGSEVVMSGSREDFKKMVEENYHVWGALVREADIAQK